MAGRHPSHDLIRAAIAYSGLGRDEIAKQLEVDTTTLDRWSSKRGGKYLPDPVQFAKLLGITGFPAALGTPSAAGDVLARIEQAVETQNRLLAQQTDILEQMVGARLLLERAVRQATEVLGPDASEAD